MCLTSFKIHLNFSALQDLKVVNWGDSGYGCIWQLHSIFWHLSQLILAVVIIISSV